MGLAELAGLPAERKGSGGWLTAAIKEFEHKNNYEIAVVTTYTTKERMKKSVGNITYYLLPGGTPANYNWDKKSNIQQWEYVKNDFKPDIIQLWGTEFPHALTAITVMNNVPSIIYVQGIKSAIGRYYLGCMTDSELRSSWTWKSFFFRKGLKNKQKEFLAHKKIELSIYQQADYVIGENSWCEANSLLLNPKIQYKVSHLPIDQIFFDYRWTLEGMKPHTIFCNASGYPVKGTHVLLKAVAIVKRKYPDVVLYVPGMQEWATMDFKAKAESYSSFLHKQIVKLNLEDNVKFLGMVSHKEMACHIQNANVYVMSSCIENHSSSLIEAMCVGAPCISSVVGGVQDLVMHGVNGMLYRYEEHALLALYIMELFENKNKCQMMSDNAVAITSTSRKQMSVYDELDTIYQEIKKDKKH